MSEKITVIANDQPVEIDARKLNVICHRNDVHVEVPDAVEIGPSETVARMRGMTQEEWTHISTGPLFKHLFGKIFTESAGEVKLPGEIDKLNRMDLGVVHACGLIVLTVEAVMANKRPFLRLPETYLHPAAQVGIVDMIMAVDKLFGIGPPQVATQEREEKTDGDKVEAEEDTCQEGGV